MKKVFIAVALVMCMGTSVTFANGTVSNVEITATATEFKAIEVKDLPQAVQDAIKKDYPEATIKSAAADATAKTY